MEMWNGGKRLQNNSNFILCFSLKPMQQILEIHKEKRPRYHVERNEREREREREICNKINLPIKFFVAQVEVER